MQVNLHSSFHSAFLVNKRRRYLNAFQSSAVTDEEMFTFKWISWVHEESLITYASNHRNVDDFKIYK